MRAREVLERFECREQCAENGEPPCFEVESAGFTGPDWLPCELCARLTTARVEALAAAGFKVVDREPTKAMVDAVETAVGHQAHNQFAYWWRLAFDAAEPQEKP